MAWKSNYIPHENKGYDSNYVMLLTGAQLCEHIDVGIIHLRVEITVSVHIVRYESCVALHCKQQVAKEHICNYT